MMDDQRSEFLDGSVRPRSRRSDVIVETDDAGKYVGHDGRTYYLLANLRRAWWKGIVVGGFLGYLLGVVLP